MSWTFRHPHFLWLLALAAVPLVREFVWKPAAAALGFSATARAARRGPTARAVGLRSLAVFRSIAIVLAVGALARPQAGDEQSKVCVEGIAIELVVDVSGSMAQEDMVYEGARRSRLETAKHVIDGFVRGRADDLIGLTTFSAYPNEVCPLTLDYGMLSKFFEHVQPDKFFGYTAIGDGIVQGAALLKESTAQSKVMVLLTDGLNNFGATHPVEAARMAAQLGIRIYAIGIVPDQAAQSSVDFFGRKIFMRGQEVDEETLRQVATEARGRYFAAADGGKLKKIYEEINKLEKTEHFTEKYLQYRELYHVPLAASLGLVFTESILGLTLFRKKP